MTNASILIVDDDETMRLICRRVLARCMGEGQLRIDDAATGEEAIEKLRSRSFDCVLTDYRMGAVSGIDVLAFAMKERPETVRILFTGFAAPAIHEAAFAQAQVHAFLEKPMTPDELETLLRERVVEPFLKPLARRVKPDGPA